MRTTKRVDRLPPNSEEAERGVLACCLRDPQVCVAEAGLKLEPESFYDLRHRTIFEELTAMQSVGVRVDMITLHERLKDKGVVEHIGGINYLSEVEDATPSAAHLPHYLEIVMAKHTLRRLIQTCTEVIGKAYDSGDKVAELLAHAEREILAVRPMVRESSTLQKLCAEAVDLIEWRANNWGEIAGLTYGLRDLDQLTDGLHPAEEVVVAAFPSCGKSAFAGHIALANAINGVPVGIATAEMRPLQLVVRSLCSHARVNFRRLDEGSCAKLANSVGPVSRLPLHLESVSGFTADRVASLARRMVQRHGIKLFIVDYIQLLDGEGDNREQQVADVSRKMTQIAKEHNIPVVALSQLNEQGQVRESRAIGQDADTMIKIKNEGDRVPRYQPVELSVDKCRDGETGMVRAMFIKTEQRFEDAAQDTREE